MANPEWRPETHRRRAPKLRSRRQQAVLLVASMLAVPAVIALVTWAMLRFTPKHLMAGCAPRGPFIALVVSRTIDSDSGSATTAEYVVFDARTGAGLGRVSLDGSGERAFCARADATRNWVVDFDGAPALAANDAARILVPWSTLARRLSVTSALASVGWDADSDRLVVNTRDGYGFAIDPATLEPRRVEGTPSLSTLGAFHDEVVPPAVVEYYVGGRDELRLADGTALELEGHPRARLLRAGQTLLGGRDFLMPSFLLHPGTGSIEWPDPPSVVVVEETEVGSLRYRLARIGLDGTVLFTHTPDTTATPSWRYRPIPYAAYDEGRVIVRFDDTAMVGLDGRTGIVRWSASYRE